MLRSLYAPLTTFDLRTPWSLQVRGSGRTALVIANFREHSRCRTPAAGGILLAFCPSHSYILSHGNIPQ
jgi:hypothetical protein